MSNITPKEAIANLNHIYGMVAPDIQRSLDVAIKCMEERPQGDCISREALKEDFKSRLADCNKWIEKAKDKETKIRASAVKAFIAEVIMTIDNAPSVPQVTVFTETADEKAVADLKAELQSVIEAIPKGEWISREDLKKAIRKRLGISSLKYLTEQEKVIVEEIDNAPTVEPVCWNCEHFGEKAVTGHCIKCRDKDMWEMKKGGKEE